jgi:hypothetical protein
MKILLAFFISLLFSHAFAGCSYDTVTGGEVSINVNFDHAAATESPLDVNCNLDWPLLQGDVRVASIVGVDVDVSLCGQCLLVIGLSGRVYVRIIDYCDDCEQRDVGQSLVLARSVVSLIGDILSGILFDTTWKFVPCPASLLGFNGNLVFRLIEATELSVKL